MTSRPLALALALSVAPLAVTSVAVPAVARAQAAAQNAAEHVRLGDRDRDADPTSALAHYEAALKLEPTNYPALAHGAYAAVEVGGAAGDAARRTQLYAHAEQLARRAIAARPNDAEGHFALAAAIGRRALTMGARDRVRFAAEVRNHAMEALKYNPRHAGALHVMGMWNAEVMRLNGVARFMARNFLGGRVFGSANWNDAERYLERAVQIEPNRLTHRLDLAEVYVDRNNAARAKEQLDFIAAAPAREARDAQFKAEAERLRARVR